ncbi:receptor expression-enhancing protein 1-like isoform X1 [Mytilus edulis]|uniref:receptor expression-enhancing protein 1-like isoform X1 n=1 Tax=Mytilus edulis TaxID=6550 RepID=UPI0039F0EA99
MLTAVFSRLLVLVFGTLYPAYASYKAIRTRNAKEYAKWMMYWVVFAFFSCAETFSDVFLSWMPFYYEIKIIFVIWLLSPMTKGSSFLFKKFVHPQLKKREKDIDEYISQARTKGYSAILSLGHRGLKYCTNVVVRTAIKGQSTLTEHVRKSYSTNDLRVPDDSSDQMDDSSISYMDDDEDELAMNKRDLEVINEEISDDEKPKYKKKKDSRLYEDNRELEKRKKVISRSNSDLTDVRRGNLRSQKEAPLASLNEEDEEIIYSEETYYLPTNNKRDYRADPYGTLPRTRAKTRGKINQ